MIRVGSGASLGVKPAGRLRADLKSFEEGYPAKWKGTSVKTNPERGREIRLLMQGRMADKFEEIQRALDPDVFEWTEEFNFGTVWARPGMDLHDRLLTAITALAAQNKPIRNYLHGALQAGVDAKKIHEALVMLLVYSGFSTGMEALQVWGDVVRAERRRGKTVECPVTDVDIEYKKPT